ncbi:hypothetical protein RHMOL_Rhmol03G0071300 [Rhododendron molle]|uniref:Uncharacterized protein n=1 Tax=Rhododendron molle TaxID=49168 RepID=A0ACC0PCX1_RHOML|nr:hypothetical protein RHMOL_Rhmol03G0071300 [Rhododendron molle]
MRNLILVKDYGKAWLDNKDQGWAAFRVHKKPKSLKLALKHWANEVFGDLQNKQDTIELEMLDLDLQAEKGSIDEASLLACSVA